MRDCDELLANIPGANALVVEALPVGAREIAAAGGSLRLVQRYGTITRNIDKAACSSAGIQVKTLRRRANISTAEQALALMLALARQLNQNANLISIEQIKSAGYTPTQYDRARTPNGNWARITGLKTLFGRQLGIIGFGEIGRELALRASALGMRIIYHQRHRLVAGRRTALSGELFVPAAASRNIRLHQPASPPRSGNSRHHRSRRA